MTPGRSGKSSRLALAFGLAAGAVYVAAALASPAGRLPVRVLFDGFAPPLPYRWVAPPAEFAATNQPALEGSSELPLRLVGTEAGSVGTGDGQASLVATERLFGPSVGQRSVVVSITPEDPERLGDPPSGLTFDGNAYTFAATYTPSGQVAQLRKRTSVVLRYPVHATVVLRWNGTAWVPHRTTAVRANLQVFAETNQLGTFVAAGPNRGTSSNRPLYIAIAAGVIAVAAVTGLVIRRRQDRREKRRQRRLRRRGGPPKRGSKSGGRAAARATTPRPKRRKKRR